MRKYTFCAKVEKFCQVEGIKGKRGEEFVHSGLCYFQVCCHMIWCLVLFCILIRCPYTRLIANCKLQILVLYTNLFWMCHCTSVHYWVLSQLSYSTRSCKVLSMNLNVSS
jgi:hypothetical protein